MQGPNSARTFSSRTLLLFVAQVFGAVMGIVNGILLARLLGPAGKGEYFLLVLLPSTMMVLLQLGLPQAFLFFAARGRTAGMLWKAAALTAMLSTVGLVFVIVLLPLLLETLLRGMEPWHVLVAFLVLPLTLYAMYLASIVMGRQAVRWYAGVNMAVAPATTVLLVGVLGGLGPSVIGAIAVLLIATLMQAIGFAVGARRAIASNASTETVSYRELLRYGLPLYPGTLTQFFSYRVDGYLIALLIAEPSTSLGYYSMAVGLAELVFFLPNAVSSLFFPHVAGSRREDSDRQVAMVSRVTLLLTAAVALLLIPAAIAMIWIALPDFMPSIVPFLVLLPGVVILSVTKVVSGYMAGIGKPAVASYVIAPAFVLNVVANLILIPRYGIVGASAASLMSYSVSSLAFTVIAARITRTSIPHFWVPRASDVRFIVYTSAGLLRRVRASALGRA